ncbi:HsmA family protein, partial [Chloroflexota bacterium]
MILSAVLIISTVLISLALVFYSIGVWSERFAGRLKGWHLIFFWGGLIFDTVGTGMMFDMAGIMTVDIHSVTGILAILL